MRKQVLVLNNPTQFDHSDEKSTAILADKFDVHWYHTPSVETFSTSIMGTLQKPDILVTAMVKLNSLFLHSIPNIEAIIAASTATDHIDLAYCKNKQIKVFNTPGYTGSSVAEHAFSLIMACSKHLRYVDESLRVNLEGRVLPSMELSGKRLGIIGLGQIGTQVANYAKCFGMEIVFFNRSRKSFPDGVPLELDDLLISSDIVVMTVPLNQDTFHLISDRELQLMKKSAFLVNIGSDELIQVDHLVSALKNRDIAGAGLDVIFEYKKYLDAPNLLLTQSRGWYTKESVERRMKSWVSTLEAYLKCNYINRII